MINTQLLAQITQPELNQQIYTQAWFSLKHKYLISSKSYKLREIDHLAHKLNEKISKGQAALKLSCMKGKMEVWAFGELKIFETVCMVHSLLVSVQLQQFTEAEYIYLNKIFLQRTDNFLKYELASLLKCRVRNNIEWKKTQIDIFAKIVEEDEHFYDQDPYKIDKFQWKYYSFQLFTRSKGKFYRTLQQCREKWINYLNPQLSHAPWNIQEDIRLFQLIGQMGFKWAGISKAFGLKRTEHMVKNRFNSMIKVWKNKDWKSIPAQDISKKVLHLLEEKVAKGAQVDKGQILQLLNFENQKSTQKNFTESSKNFESFEHNTKIKKQKKTVSKKIEFEVQQSRDEYGIVEEAAEIGPTIYDWNRRIQSATNRFMLHEKDQRKTRDNQEQQQFDELNYNSFKLGTNQSGTREFDMFDQGLSTFKLDFESDRNGLMSLRDEFRNNELHQLLGHEQMYQDESWMVSFEEKDLLSWVD